ncbi:MAG TPA: DUF5937 family protein, partial [Humibacter sp.]|nr:DUF5937 family protein [Humibacter sp.]
PLAELVASLHVLSEPDHHPDRAQWTVDVRGRLDDATVAAIERTDYLWRVSRPEVFLPAAGGVSLAEELRGIDALPHEEWVRSVLLTSSCGSLRLRPDLGSPLIDDRARDVALERAAARGPHASQFVDEVLLDPERMRADVRAVMLAYDEQFFAGEWEDLKPRLTMEANGRRNVLATVGIAATLPGMSGSLSFDDGRIVIDKLQDASARGDGTGVTFLPTFVGDPHILVTYAPDRRPVVQYPVRRSTPSTEADLETIQARVRALDHPLRLRLLRSLVRGPRSTAELSDAWNVTPPQVSRHLAVMLEAGLVTTRRDGRFVLYSADAVEIQRLGIDLLLGLLR